MGIAATIPDRFVVTQDIFVTADTLISLSPRVTDLRSLKELISEPNIFLQNRFALALLAKRLEMRLPATESRGTGMSLIDKVDQCLTLDMTEGNIVQVAYTGDHRNEGEAMVAFYSERLIRQAEDYLALNRSAVKSGAAIPRKIGRVTVSEKRSLWCDSRLVPAVLIFGITLVVLICLITLLDWFKLSFRSERHIADYLSVPVLGAFPDLNDIAREQRVDR